MHWEHCHLASCKRGTFLLAFGFSKPRDTCRADEGLGFSLCPSSQELGEGEIEISILGKLHRGKGEGMGYDIPLRHSAGLKVTTARFLVLEMCRRFRSFSWDRRPQPGWVSHSFLYKQLLWVRNGSLPSSQGHRMDIYIHGYLICLLLVLFHSETACHPLGKRPCEMQAFR